MNICCYYLAQILLAMGVQFKVVLLTWSPNFLSYTANLMLSWGYPIWLEEYESELTIKFFGCYVRILPPSPFLILFVGLLQMTNCMMFTWEVFHSLLNLWFHKSFLLFLHEKNQLFILLIAHFSMDCHSLT